MTGQRACERGSKGAIAGVAVEDDRGEAGRLWTANQPPVQQYPIRRGEGNLHRAGKPDRRRIRYVPEWKVDELSLQRPDQGAERQQN